MANRFLETNYYKSPFVRGLKGALKGLYSFIICDCTASGIWALDMEAASMYTGFNVTFQEFEESFINRGKAFEISEGKYFFPDFIEHQYPKGLQEKNLAHKNVISELIKLGIINSDLQIKKEYIKGASKGHQSPKGNGNGEGKGNGNGEGKELEKIFLDDKLLVPEMFSTFKKSLPDYPAFADKDFKPLFSIASFLHKQSGLNGHVVNNQKVIIQEWGKMCEIISKDNFYSTKPLSTISNSIQEIYQITKNGRKINSNFTNGNSKTTLYTGNVDKGAFGKP